MVLITDKLLHLGVIFQQLEGVMAEIERPQVAMAVLAVEPLVMGILECTEMEYLARVTMGEMVIK